ncbi:hypothetical protein PR048_026960 [Dryococelus australis]|uniref:Reverse transcriptase RNase H-like domain-containing protein n=1 Tax=Dryococelus australis TaxID=614101 RepID=A0ABQ9GMS2_9NEOP|nr:hypothetical protein PR048_026960 [Dryococelus australis]
MGRSGKIPDVVLLRLRKGAQPVFNRERDVPYALMKKVDTELDTLEAEGVLTKVETSDWGLPLVVIPKADGVVRLCIDYKVGVNERLQMPTTKFGKIDDILNGLRNSRFFCQLDLFTAYLHVPVDEQSSEIQIISIHHGTYRLHRLSFRISTAASEFNRVNYQILCDVPKLCHILMISSMDRLERIQLACDASPTGIARVLSHIVDGNEYPNAFASRLLTAAEKNYSQLDRETLAIVFTVDNFFQYLFGSHFKLVTDSQPLT